MRLICPNCDAEYQVDDAAIPETGRDVQCSNCGHAWFQLPPDAEIAREAEEELFGDAQVTADQSAPPEPAEAAPDPVIADPASDDPAPEEAVPKDTPAPVVARQTLAESVLSVLREEAERETAVRRDQDAAARTADAPERLETQTEFGLSETAQPERTSAAARHIARLKGSDPDMSPAPGPKTAARRDLLPDIDMINSTLRTETDRVQAEMDDIDALPTIRPQRAGFRSGFVLMIVLAVACAMAYIMAPRIIAQIPGSAPGMRAYVATVDQGRLWLDGLMKSASGSLRGLSGDGN